MPAAVGDQGEVGVGRRMMTMEAGVRDHPPLVVDGPVSQSCLLFEVFLKLEVSAN